MKRTAIIALMLLAGLAAGARTIHYFTRSQAERTVRCLNAQDELMIYCGYDYEIETYVLVSDVWMERVNSAYYEIWLFGWDAYTGDEVYMPIDLNCIWLLSSGRTYNAAQYLRFKTSVRQPDFAWQVPPYNRYSRIHHTRGHSRSFHYDIHRHGWMPPAAPAPGMHSTPLPPYYMRQRTSRPPMPEARWTPGVDRPRINHPTPASEPQPVRSTTVTPSRAAGPATPARNSNTTPSRAAAPATPAQSTSTTPTRAANPATQSAATTTTTNTPSRKTETHATTTTTTPSRNATPATPSRRSTTTTRKADTPSSSSTATRQANTPNTTTTPSRAANTASPAKSSTTPSRKADNPSTNATTTRKADTPAKSSSATPSRAATPAKSHAAPAQSAKAPSRKTN